MTLIASSFLAGSLLSLLIPVTLLIALVFWYVKFIARVPETDEGEEANAAPAGGNLGPGANPSPAGNPAAGANPGPGGAPEARPREG